MKKHLIGPVIDARRVALRLSKVELARKAGVSKQTMGSWCKGRSMPSEARMVVLAAALETTDREIYAAAVAHQGEDKAA